MNIIEPAIILIRPQLPENIGMVARAMHNFNFKKLILVSPREKWPNKKALSAAANAKTIINNTKIFNSIKLALSPFHFVIATSSRKRDLNKPHYYNFLPIFKSIPTNNKKIAIVFGPENSGLSNCDLMLCDNIFTFSLSKENQSLNLSHSVLLMIFKWKEYFDGKSTEKNNKTNISNKRDFQTFMNFLKCELDNVGFLYPKEKSQSMFNNIQTMFLRAQLSKTEIQTLWGMLNKLIKQRKKERY